MQIQTILDTSRQFSDAEAYAYLLRKAQKELHNEELRKEVTKLIQKFEAKEEFINRMFINSKTYSKLKNFVPFSIECTIDDTLQDNEVKLEGTDAKT